MTPNAQPPANDNLPAHPTAEPTRIAFVALSGGRREVQIEHAGQVYRLSLTAQNKLLLTK